MSVKIELSPLLRKYIPGYDADQGVVLDSGHGKKVIEIINEVGIPQENVTFVLVNHRPSHFNYVTKNGDLIRLSMVMGGG